MIRTLTACTVAVFLAAAPAAAQVRPKFHRPPATPVMTTDPATTNGPHEVGRDTFTVADPTRGGRQYPVDVWFPAKAPTSSRSVIDMVVAKLPTNAWHGAQVADGRHPLVLFSHGSDAIGYQSFEQAEAIASRGFIVAAPTHTGHDLPAKVFGTTVSFAQTMNDRHHDLVTLTDRLLAPDSKYAPFVALERPGDPLLAVSGHSIGAVAALTVGSEDTNEPGWPLIVKGDPRVDAIMVVGPAVFFLPSDLGHTRPVLIVGGTADDITPPAQADRVWATSDTYRKFRIDMHGVRHAAPSSICRFRDTIAAALWSNPTDKLTAQVLTSIQGTSQGACEPGEVDPGLINRTTSAYMVSFLQRQLKADPGAHTWLSRARSNRPTVVPNNYWRCDERVPVCDQQPA